MRTVIVPEIIRVGQTGDNVSLFELVIEDLNGRSFALQLDGDACCALRQAVTDLERRISEGKKPATLADDGPVA
ncbi:hypothetical protein [Aquamicrobium ahrensii]|uniref:Uncharacterized protein n=1 Tax=Aquamicrobium ahrensii TaxID=469551 RepID=A0ABV2KIL3_9HYPH